MHEAQRRLLAQAVPGLRRSQADGGEGRLDGVHRQKALPVRRLLQFSPYTRAEDNSQEEYVYQNLFMM